MNIIGKEKDVFNQTKYRLNIYPDDLNNVNQLLKELVDFLQLEETHISLSIFELLTDKDYLVNNSLTINVYLEGNRINSKFMSDLKMVQNYFNRQQFIHRFKGSTSSADNTIDLTNISSIEELHTRVKELLGLDLNGFYNFDAMVDDMCDFVTYSKRSILLVFQGDDRNFINKMPSFMINFLETLDYLNHFRVLNIIET